ncbi:MAG TPA: phosphoribosylanthranilate isomerase [Pseudomonadales bacterium]|nr:phosphoribosylanthranilate isomerase [Pseudomonadales bacterium]
MVRIKICGITRPEDALAAAAAGADAIGLNFHPASPRFVDLEAARAICAVTPPFVTLVGLFVDAPEAQIREALSVLPLHMLQFHGEESVEDCCRWQRPWLKALRMRPELDVLAAARAYPGAAALLLDSYRPGVPGGTGETFSWDRIPPDLPRPLVLAGGLDAANVGRAVAAVRPAAVDVSGGVERTRGVKDAAMMRAFVQAVHGSAMEQSGNEQ